MENIETSIDELYELTNEYTMGVLFPAAKAANCLEAYRHAEYFAGCVAGAFCLLKAVQEWTAGKDNDLEKGSIAELAFK